MGLYICQFTFQILYFKSYKTPTSILTNGAGEFVAMGYDAEEKYTEETEDGASVDLHLFRHFKMKLHKTKVITN